MGLATTIFLEVEGYLLYVVLLLVVHFGIQESSYHCAYEPRCALLAHPRGYRRRHLVLFRYRTYGGCTPTAYYPSQLDIVSQSALPPWLVVPVLVHLHERGHGRVMRICGLVFDLPADAIYVSAQFLLKLLAVFFVEVPLELSTRVRVATLQRLPSLATRASGYLPFLCVYVESFSFNLRGVSQSAATSQYAPSCFPAFSSREAPCGTSTAPAVPALSFTSMPSVFSIPPTVPLGSAAGCLTPYPRFY